MKAPSEHDLSKLPRWARSLIESLQRDVQAEHERMEVLLGKRQSHVSFQAYPDMERRALPDWSHFAFDLGSNGNVEVHLEEQPAGLPPLLAIRFTRGRMVVLPAAANSIYMRGEP